MRARSFAGPAVVVTAALLAAAPLLLRGPSCGHDFDFHLVSWLDAQSAWKHGLLYPHWAPSANYGAGEPRFVFYPPLTWMLGAALGLLLPWTLVPAALTFVLLAASGLATRLLARLAFNDAAATLAGCVAIFSGYALFTAYERTAFGELAGGCWIPLLVWCALRRFSSRYLQIVALALTLAGAWLSNAPLGVMSAYLLAFLAVALAVQGRAWRVFPTFAAAAALGLGAVAFYLVPAAVEQKYVNIAQATDDPGERIENSFFFAHHADPLLADHDAELLKVSRIGAWMLGFTLVGFAFAWRRGLTADDKRLYLPLILLAGAVLFLQLPCSLPVWNALPRLRFLQFPWRWYVALEAPMAVAVVAAVWPAKRAVRYVVGAAFVLIFAGAALFAGTRFQQFCDDEDSVAGMMHAYTSGAGFVGTDEYYSAGWDSSLPQPANAPDVCLLERPRMNASLTSANADVPQEPVAECAQQWSWTSHSPEHLRLQAKLPEAGDLRLRVLLYPLWRVTIQGHTVTPHGENDLPWMVIPAPQGQIDLRINWQTPADVWLGRALSLLSVLALTLLAMAGFRQRRARVE